MYTDPHNDRKVNRQSLGNLGLPCSPVSLEVGFPQHLPQNIN